ncbi:MAG TPA: DNA translocase FtsK 4TM domain-containing protein [Candidatus Limnocylindria bacterium]|nr:DNA translocase FtsK 4TM domain-containing protein [Candidatus Limnocylindria bacterium]
MARRSAARRSTSRSRRRRSGFSVSGRLVREALALVLVFMAIVSVIALFAPRAGFIVEPWHDALVFLLGWGIAFAAPLLAGFAVMLWMKSMQSERWMAASGAALVAVSLLGAFHLVAGGGERLIRQGDGGGVIGFWASRVIVAAVGQAGAWIVLALLFVVGLLLYFNMTIGDLVAAYVQRRDERADQQDAEARRVADHGGRRAEPGPPSPPEPEGRSLLGRVRDVLTGGDQDEPPLIVRRARPEATTPAMAGVSPTPSTPPTIPPVAPASGSADAVHAIPISAEALESTETAHLAEVGEHEASDAALEGTHRSWRLPDLDLLNDAEASSAAQLDLPAKGRRIRETLSDFGIGVKVARIQEGPVVTQYALEVDPGIKLSRIEGLADNLALALAARSIRIQAPIPGEPYVGIEIPNAAFELVTLKEVLASRNFEDAATRSKLAFALGQDVAGQPFSADLSKMPHLLIAGATGSGKSVCVNALICSLLMRATPAEVKLILIDPKRVEMAQYRGIPHLLTEVIVDTEKAVNALKWTVGTMESRYHEFAQRGVRNIAGYNAALRVGEPRMPYIVVVIDELADLMMVSAYEVEATITRIAQLARATGIHLVVATQRPSVQVITGLIKANIPSRIAFAMTSGVDSRTILDTTGAEDLLGQGDMLYQPIDAPRAVRLQGALVKDDEIDAVARHWRGQGAPQYRPEVTATRRDGKAGSEPGEDGDGDADPLLSQAVDIVRRSDKASASLLQRRLRVGYARAARILDQMEDRGIVGPADGSRFREVLVTSDGWGGEVAPGEDHA